MKIPAKHSIWAALAILSFLPGMAGAACNDTSGNTVTLAVKGPKYVPVESVNLYSLTFNPTNVDTSGGTYDWTYTAFQEVSTTNNSIVLEAPDRPSNSKDDKTIQCDFTKTGWSSSTDCSAQTNVTVFKITQDYSELEFQYGPDSAFVANGKWHVEPALNGVAVTVKGKIGGEGFETFNINGVINNGILSFDGFPSSGSFRLDGGMPTVDWSISFEEGYTNSIGSATLSPFSHRWQENALSQGRKISLSGMPMPDVAQHQEGESDYQPENTYIDALDLDVRHDVTDIFVPVGSDHFALEVRRSLTQESWTTNSYQLSDRPDKPFGPCWSSAICPALHIEETGVGSSTITFTDHNGQAYTYRYGAGATNGVVVNSTWAEPTSSQSALSLQGVSYTNIAGTGWVLSLPNGTKCTYSEDPDVEAEVAPQLGGGFISTHRYYRILQVEDRAHNILEYGEPAYSNSIIPSTISSGDQSQSLTIHTIDNKRIDWIRDPRNNQVTYHYNADGRLGSVEREDGGTTEYTYAGSTEPDTKATLYWRIYAGAPAIDSHHLTIHSIADANGNTNTFAYTNAVRYDYSEIPQIATGNTSSNKLYQIGNPRILESVERPDGHKIFLSEPPEMGTGLGLTLDSPTRVNTVVDVNSNTWTYTFSDYHTTDPTRSGSEIRLFEYKKLTITAPGGGTETYRFEPLGVRMSNGLDPMAIVAQTNFSGAATTFEYAFASNGCYKPSVQYDALDNPTRYTYTANYGNQVESETDALGRYTLYQFDALGNRTNVTVYSSTNLASSVKLSETWMEYNSATFSNFMTRQIVKKVGDESETWIKDMVTQFVPDAYGKVAQKIVDPGGAGHLNLTTTFDYDLNNNLISVIDPRGNETVNQYDALNRLTNISFYAGSGETKTWKCDKRFWYDLRSNKRWEKDENGHYTFFGYDKFNNPIKTIRIMSESFTGSIINVMTANNYAKAHLYQGSSAEIITTSEYNPDGTLHATVDPRGLRTEFQYDALRRLTNSIVDPGTASTNLNYETSYAYSTNGNYCGGITLPPYKFIPTSVTDPRGYTTETIYDALNRPVETKAQITGSNQNPLVTLSTMGYDDVGNLITVSNKVSASPVVWQVTQTRYDGLNRPYMVLNADGTTNGVCYTTTGLRWQTTNELGRVATVEYDAAGRPVKAKSPQLADNSQAVTETGYDANGNVLWVKDANFNTTTNIYDYRNRPVQTIAPAMQDWGTPGYPWVHPTVTTVYDHVGNAVSITDAESNTTTNFYDAANRMYATWAPPVNVYGVSGTVRPTTTNTFDKAGNITATRDANGKVVQMQYDAIGRLTNTIDAVANTIGFVYDANGNQTALIDGKGNRTDFVYDGLNRKTSTIYPQVNGTRNEEIAGYDLVGNRIRRTDCNNAITHYAYDLRNRLSTVRYGSDASNPNRTRDYAYDVAGNLTNVVESADANACVSYTYDALNRISTETSVGVTHQYQYDLNGNRTSAVYGVTGLQTRWQYDALNRIVKISESGNDTEYYYDLNGKLIWRVYPSQTCEWNQYDAMGRLTGRDTYLAPDWSQYLSVQYQYDAVGSARQMNQTSSGLAGKAKDATTSWFYDDRYRLVVEIISTNSAAPPNVRNYYWDAADNRYRSDRFIGGQMVSTTTYTNNALNQVTGWACGTTNATYAYDANGNRTNKSVRIAGGSPATTTYDYDEDNRLLQASVGSVVNAFKYDYRSRRYYRATSTETNICVFDGGLSIQEYDVSSASYQLSASDTPTVEYLRGPDLGGGVGGMVYSIRNGERIYSHANHRGDVIARSNDSGSLTWYALYEAYGTRPAGCEWSDGATGNPDRQKANTKDEETEIGLLNEQMRYRDLETGTFLTRDPIGYADGPNVYCYVHCNPITHFDALGLESKDIVYNSHFEWGDAGKVWNEEYVQPWKNFWGGLGNAGKQTAQNYKASAAENGHIAAATEVVCDSAKSIAVNAYNDVHLFVSDTPGWIAQKDEQFKNTSMLGYVTTSGLQALGMQATLADDLLSLGDDALRLADDVAPKSRFFHSTSDAAVDPIMKGGFRTDIPNPQAAFHNNRFGRGVYLSDSPAAALAERPGGVVLNVDASLGRNLNIVNRGPILDAQMGKAIGRGARKHGFDSISTMSVQPNGGINTIIFDPANVRATGVLP